MKKIVYTLVISIMTISFAACKSDISSADEERIILDDSKFANKGYVNYSPEDWNNILDMLIMATSYLNESMGEIYAIPEDSLFYQEAVMDNSNRHYNISDCQSFVDKYDRFIRKGPQTVDSIISKYQRYEELFHDYEILKGKYWNREEKCIAESNIQKASERKAQRDELIKKDDPQDVGYQGAIGIEEGEPENFPDLRYTIWEAEIPSESGYATFILEFKKHNVRFIAKSKDASIDQEYIDYYVDGDKLYLIDSSDKNAKFNIVKYSDKELILKANDNPKSMTFKFVDYLMK